MYARLKLEEDEDGAQLVVSGPGWVRRWTIWSVSKVKRWLRRFL